LVDSDIVDEHVGWPGEFGKVDGLKVVGEAEIQDLGDGKTMSGQR
jgi:hypothetical protein